MIPSRRTEPRRGFGWREGGGADADDTFEHDYRAIVPDFADGVLKLSINREDHLNAINYYVLEEFIDALGHAARLDEVRVVALAGVGDRAARAAMTSATSRGPRGWVLAPSPATPGRPIRYSRCP